MADPIGDASIEITADTGPLQQAGPAIEQAINEPLADTEQLAAQASAKMEELAQRAAQLNLGDTEMEQFNHAMGVLRDNMPETEEGLGRVNEMMDTLTMQAEQSAAAMDDAGEGANRWGGQLLNLGRENQKMVADTGLVTGRVASLNQILTIAAGRTGQLAVGVRLLRSAFSLALAPGAALGVAVAGLTSATAFLIRTWKEWDEQAQTLATTMREIGENTDLTRAKVRGLVDDFDAVFNERVVGQLELLGFNMDELTTSTDEQRTAMQGLAEEWFTWQGIVTSTPLELLQRAWNALPVARYAEQLERTAAVEERVDRILTANAARREYEFIRLYGVSEQAYDGMLANLQRINDEAGKIGDNFVREFSNWQDVIAGVPAQLEISAQDIANNAQDVLYETALMLRNYEDAIKAGLPEIAEAIKEAGPEANDAFSEVLNNPELANLIERDLQDTARIIDEEAEKAVGRFVSEETKRAFRDEWGALSQEAIDGMVAGLENGLPQVLAAVDRLTSQIVARARVDLGIESPSRVMKQQVGVPITEGVGDGILAAAPYATHATDRTIDDILDAGRRTVPDATDVGTDIGRGIGRGVADGLRESLDAALALLDATIRQVDVAWALEDAQSRYEELADEFDALPGRIRDIQDALAAEREFAALITPAEQVAIERAEAALEKILRNREASAEASAAAEAELNNATAQRVAAENALMGAWDQASRDRAQAQLDEANRRITAANAYQDEIDRSAASEAEAALAAERVAEAHADAIAPTREQVRLEEELADAQNRRQEIGRELAQAELDVLRAQVDVIRSQIDYTERLNEVRGAGLRELERWANQTTLPADVVARIIAIAGGDIGAVVGRATPNPIPYSAGMNIGSVDVQVLIDGDATISDARRIADTVGETVIERLAAYAAGR